MVHNEANVPSNDDHLYNRNDYLCGCTVVLRIINRSLFTSDWNRFINSNHIQYVFINLSSPSAWGGHGNYWSCDNVRTCNWPYIIRRHCGTLDRKSTRLNSSHVAISYAVFCLKKKKHKTNSCHTLLVDGRQIYQL